MAKGIKYATKLSGMSASLTVFLCSAIIFARTKGVIDLDTLIYYFCIVVPGAFIVGFLSFYIGKIFDTKKKKKKLNKFIR